MIIDFIGLKNFTQYVPLTVRDAKELFTSIKSCKSKKKIMILFTSMLDAWLNT
mgnify:FL=1